MVIQNSIQWCFKLFNVIVINNLRFIFDFGFGLFNKVFKLFINNKVSPPSTVINSQQPSDVINSPPSVLENLPPSSFESNIKTMPVASVAEILSIELNKDVHGDDKLYRFKRGITLRLTPGPSLLGKWVSVLTNYPTDATSEFASSQYTALKWHAKDEKSIIHHPKLFAEITNLDLYCEIKTNRAGGFHFYFLFEDAKAPQGSLYIQIEPIVRVGPPETQKRVPLDSIRCQTVMSKCLGPLNTWESKLRVTKESGYNLIHFTPIQHLGGSRSGYSLQDQLKVNPEFGAKATYADVEKIITKCREEWGIASICDIVLNHTANESEWIQEHPDTTYSCATCPYLRPAFLLDAMLSKVGEDVNNGLLEHVGVPPVIELEQHLDALRHQVHSNYLQKLKLYELYQCDIEKYVKLFQDTIRKQLPTTSDVQSSENRSNEIVLIQDPEYKRLGSTIDFKAAEQIFNVYRGDCFDEDTRLKQCSKSFRDRLEFLNREIQQEIECHLNCAINNCISGTRYERIDQNGPKVREISIKYPLFMVYFTNEHVIKLPLEEIEKEIIGEPGQFCMAHNGWVINGDPLKDFARQQEGTGNVYLRRELISWGDSVKLRYGDKPEDSPYLWKHMREYVNITAKIFDGVRLDNCHSTPLHVAEYLLNEARKVNPELYVVAELFTNSDSTDNIFVNRLGITSLIREALSAWDSHEEGRLVYRYGGVPVGAFFNSPKRIVAPVIAHALFLDLTHDNPSPVQKRSVFDLLPSAGLVAMACCATGSNRGYDELVPEHIHVVDEERQYQEWDKNVNINSGIIAAKRALNLLHGEMAEQGFNQVYVDQMTTDIVAVTRHSPITHQTIILVANTSFSYPSPDAGPSQVRALRFEGNLDEIILEAELTHKTGKPFDRPNTFEKNAKYINGLNEYELTIREHISLNESKIFSHEPYQNDKMTELNFANLRPGSLVAIRVSIAPNTKPHLNKTHDLAMSFYSETGDDYLELKKIIGAMDLIDLNRALYRCDQEETDMGNGSGTYNIPNYGHLVYSGFQGFNSVLMEIAPHNDLGHPLCCNLRDGNWMIDYVHQRLENYKGTAKFGGWLNTHFEPLKEIPRYLIPSYFDVIVTNINELLKQHCFELMSDFIKSGSSFIKALSLGSVQCVALCQSANLPKLSPATKPPKPQDHCATLAAGLPHFATGYMRCWGRDTFISLRGLLILCGRFDEARYIILAFASTLRHGLIPNLLDSGTNPRFNCRDAFWWWLYCISQYVTEAPNGKELLSEKVSRIFPTDDSDNKPAGECDQYLYDIIQEGLRVHFQGLVYRERNAGQQIDAYMVDQGFNVQIGINPDTGFVFGGNDWNCGTWMDKMGSSETAGNRGKPSTPRDGSAIELIGLQTASLRFLEKMHASKSYPYVSVERTSRSGTKTTWTYKEWADRIKANFEKWYYVADDDNHELVNKRGIYKDTNGASKPWTDYQLRCNFPITMVVAPELFDPKHAWIALEQAKKYLLGPLGMKTLDPEDWAYRGFYDNSNQSNDPSVAHGANYHQGPEWLWPIGYYFRARLHFSKLNGTYKEARAEVLQVLSAHLKEIKTSHWRGLPELTNKDGAFCEHSCATQAWSMATILETLFDLKLN